MNYLEHPALASKANADAKLSLIEGDSIALPGNHTERDFVFAAYLIRIEAKLDAIMRELDINEGSDE